MKRVEMSPEASSGRATGYLTLPEAWILAATSFSSAKVVGGLSCSSSKMS
jgi:hypothetical protein